MQSRLPEDHYRYIICHIQDRKDLLSLRLASRALGHEATKVLYRTVELEGFNKSLCPLLSYLSKYRRPAFYVEKLSIKITSKIPFWSDSQSSKLIRGFLRKAHNLKELCILTTGRGVTHMTLGEITEGVKFSLLHLKCNLPAGESCSRFLQSQPGIVDLCWLSDSVPTMANSHLPHLATLEIRTNRELLMAFLPDSKVVRLKHGPLRHLLRGTFNKIEVLNMFGWLVRGEALSQLFPNLRYLAASFYGPDYVLYNTHELFKLQKLVIYRASSWIDYQNTTFVPELYTTHPALHCIEISDGYRWCYKFERTAPYTPDQILNSPEIADPDEWKSWR